MNEVTPIPMINKTHKFILYTNGKCGGTILKSWFLGTLELEKTFHNLPTAIAHYGFSFVALWYTKFFGLHDASIILSDEKYIRFFIDGYRKSTKNLLHDVQYDDNYYKFAVVREPYSRIVSAYVDKFCGADISKPWVQEVVATINNNADGIASISFNQFLNYLLCADNDSVDAHWRRQNFIMSDVKIDKFINLINVQVGLFDVSKLLQVRNIIKKGAPRQSQQYAANNNQRNSIFVGNIGNIELMEDRRQIGHFPSKEQFYNIELKGKVKQIYKEDFERFSFDY